MAEVFDSNGNVWTKADASGADGCVAMRAVGVEIDGVQTPEFLVGDTKDLDGPKLSLDSEGARQFQALLASGAIHDFMGWPLPEGVEPTSLGLGVVELKPIEE